MLDAHLVVEYVRNARGRVAWCVQDANRQRAELKRLAVLEEPVELRAIGLQIVHVVDRFERRLHSLDVLANAVRSVGALGLQVLRSSQMVCTSV